MSGGNTSQWWTREINSFLCCLVVLQAWHVIHVCILDAFHHINVRCILYFWCITITWANIYSGSRKKRGKRLKWRIQILKNVITSLKRTLLERRPPIISPFLHFFGHPRLSGTLQAVRPEISFANSFLTTFSEKSSIFKVRVGHSWEISKYRGF